MLSLELEGVLSSLLVSAHNDFVSVTRGSTGSFVDVIKSNSDDALRSDVDIDDGESVQM